MIKVTKLKPYRMVEVWERVLAYTGVQDKRLTGRVSWGQVHCTDPCLFSVSAFSYRPRSTE